MNAREFCYWLMGHFELEPHAANGQGMGAPQTLTIRSHLALVAEVDREHDNAFVEWLSVRLGSGATMNLDAAEVAKVKRLLAAQFKHVIDPSYGGDKATLQAVHDVNTHPQDGPYTHHASNGGLPYGPGYRC